MRPQYLSSRLVSSLSLVQKLRPKPGFPLNETQKHEKALVLDEELDIKVPGAINTYLREYQREGVKFMYRQYKEGRGGLLGDDMGLVSRLLRFGSNRAHQLFLSSFRV